MTQRKAREFLERKLLHENNSLKADLAAKQHEARELQDYLVNCREAGGMSLDFTGHGIDVDVSLGDYRTTPVSDRKSISRLDESANTTIQPAAVF
jgi:hypothetical protein